MTNKYIDYPKTIIDQQKGMSDNLYLQECPKSGELPTFPQQFKQF